MEHRQQNLLKKSKILQVVNHLAQKRRGKVYLVGGAVRDLLLQKTLGKDYDFVIAGKAGDLAKEVAMEAGGHAFPLDESSGTWRVILKKGKKKNELDLNLFQFYRMN